MAAKTKRKKIDWEKVESEYRAGLLSLREIGRQCDVTDTSIRRKAKAEGWERDLSAKIKSKVRVDLSRTESRTHTPDKEKEIIEAAAAQSVEVVRSHRKRFVELHEVADLLTGRLKDEAGEGEDVRGMAQSLANVTSTVNTLTKLERQAFNLDDDNNSGGDTIDKFLDEVVKRNQPLVCDED